MDRKTFLEELQLRQQIREVIQIVYRRKAAKVLSEERVLRSCIRKLIQEVVDAEPASNPNRSTGITVLDEEVLQNIIPIFKKYYMQLDNAEKRESFRSHIINAAENLLSTIGSGQEEGGETALAAAPEEPEVEPLAEQDVSMNVSPKDDPMFIPVEDDKPDPETAERDEFRSGMDGELSPDQEVGALRAQTAFNGPDTTIKKAYKDLRGEDAALFGEYLITNLKLHFDAMEEEISMTPEPTTPSYEEAAAEMGGEVAPPDDVGGAPPADVPMDAGPPADMGAPAGAPAGAPIPPEEGAMPPGM